MNRTAALSAGVVVAVALAATSAGCGSKSTNSGAPAATSTAAVTTTTSTAAQPKVALLPDIPDPNPTIAGYLEQNGISRTPVHRGDPGAPAIALPVPEGWADAGPDTPAGAYYAVVPNSTDSGGYTPSIVAWVSKLTGEVNQQQILDLAGGQLKNLPGFAAMADGSTGTLAGFPAYQFGGSWAANGQTKMIAQKTVVIATADGVYLLQVNADSLEDQLRLVVPATVAIDQQTTITT